LYLLGDEREKKKKSPSKTNCRRYHLHMPHQGKEDVAALPITW